MIAQYGGFGYGQAPYGGETTEGPPPVFTGVVIKLPAKVSLDNSGIIRTSIVSGDTETSITSGETKTEV